MAKSLGASVAGGGSKEGSSSSLFGRVRKILHIKEEEKRAQNEAPLAQGMSLADVSTLDLPGTLTERKGKNRLGFSKDADPAASLEAYKKGLNEVYPHMKFFWQSFGAKTMRLARDPRYEHHYRKGGDRYFQYQIVQQFLGDNGQILDSKIESFFRNNRDAYDTTMLFIDYETDVSASVQGIADEITTGGAQLDALLADFHIESGGVDAKGVAIGAAQVAAGGAIGALSLGTEIMTLVSLAKGIPAYMTALSTTNPALYSLLVSLGGGYVNIAGSVVSVGLIANGIGNFVRGLSTDAARDEFFRTCRASYDSISRDVGLQEYAREMYGIDPADIRVRKNSRSFRDNNVPSPGWRSAKERVAEGMALRHLYNTKVLGMESGSDLGTQLTGKTVLAEQSRAIYVQEIYLEFYRIITSGEFTDKRKNPPVTVDRFDLMDDVTRRQIMFMAERRVIEKRASAAFETVLRTQETSESTRNKTIVANLKTQLGENGALRAELQKNATKTRESAETLLNGTEIAGVRKNGLTQEMAVLTGGTTSESIGKETSFDRLRDILVKEFASLEDLVQTYSEIYEKYNNVNTSKTINKPGKNLSQQDIEGLVTVLYWYSNETSGYWKTELSTQINSDETRLITKKGELNAEEQKPSGRSQKGGQGQPPPPPKDNEKIGSLKTEISILETRISETKESFRVERESIKSAINTLREVVKKREQILALLGSSGEKYAQMKELGEEYKADYDLLTVNGQYIDLFAGYPSQGSTLDDLLTHVNRLGNAPWTQVDNGLFENRMRVMHAVAYAKSVKRYNSTVGTAQGQTNIDIREVPTPNTLRNYLLSNLTQEQIIIIGPDEVFRRLADASGKITTNNALIKEADASGTQQQFDQLSIDEQKSHIRRYYDDECKRYDAFKFGITELDKQQKVLIEQMKRNEADIGKKCKERSETLAVVAKIIDDRAEVYKKIPELLSPEKAGRLFIADNISAASTAGLVDKMSYLSFEINSQLPVGIIEVMRTVFSYQDNTDVAVSQEKAFNTIVEAMNRAGSPSEIIKKAILNAFPDFGSYFTTGNIASTLTPVDVMKVMESRIKGDGTPSGVTDAKIFSVPQPLKSSEIKAMLKYIIDAVVTPAVNGYI